MSTIDHSMASRCEAHSASAGGTSIMERYAAVREMTLSLAQPLSAEDCQVQSMVAASPVKWHLAHTTWFFEEFVLRRFAQKPDPYEPFDSRFGFLFNSYYNAVGDRVARDQRGLMTRPALEEVRAYRAHVDERMITLCSSMEASEFALARPIIEIGLQHEQQHQELILTDVKHLLWMNPLRPAYDKKVEGIEEIATDEVDVLLNPHAAGDLSWFDYPAGQYDIGHEGEGFAYDNESPRHRVYVHGFRVASRPVSNRAYLAFVEDGGYERAALWLDAGWATVCEQGWRHPIYWMRGDGDEDVSGADADAGADIGRVDWRQFTLGGVKPLCLDEPVCHVSYFEADAFARWAGKRLATEQEWEVAAAGSAMAGGCFQESRRFHPQALTGMSDDAGPVAMLGDVWEWTASQYSAYPGFRQAAGALGEYNGKFMCNQFVLRGGSCVTPKSHIRRTYRNFFPPESRWQFSGIRLAEDSEDLE